MKVGLYGICVMNLVKNIIYLHLWIDKHHKVSKIEHHIN